MPTGSYADLIGQRFGRLVVTKRAPNTPGQDRRWVCRCDCGGKTVARTGGLSSGKTRSCGCLQREASAERATKHGWFGTAEYKVWLSIKGRCHRKTDSSYHRYGARGIKVCKRWRDSFEAFIADVGKRPSPQHQIERTDNNGNYEPGNVRWATRHDQARNKRTTVNITFRGRTMCQSDWAKELGMNVETLYNRITRFNWSVKRALTTPIGPQGKRYS